MARTTLSLEELDRRIAIVRDNLRQLVEQAAAQSGASDDDRASQRIADYEAELTQHKEQREDLTRDKRKRVRPRPDGRDAARRNR